MENNQNNVIQGETNKQGLSILSLISFLVSVLGLILYCMAFEVDVRFILVITSIASVILPIVAKKIRLDNNKKGKVLEILSIILGGFDFYCVIFALTQWPIFIAYLGWICCGIFYKLIK